MTLSFDSFSKEYRVTLSGALSHTVKLGTDIYGNITRLDNALEGFTSALENCTEQLEQVRSQLQAAQGEATRPFAQESEYAEKSARLKEVNSLLDMDERDNTVLDAEPDAGDMKDERKAPAMER
jgi:ABC-type transporter Mla subunit MlaD